MAAPPDAAGDAGEDTCTPLVNFLVRQRKGRLGRLYANAWTCEAVVRALPPVARHYALRLVALGDDGSGALVPEALLEGWSRSRGAHQAALRWLLDLSILEHAPQAGMLALNAAFREQLGSLLRGLQPPKPRPPNRHTPTADELDAHAASQWDALLLCVMQPSEWRGAESGYDMPRALLHPAGLVEVRHVRLGGGGSESDESGDDGGGGERVPVWAMSRRGALFVLQELSAQAWHILQVYIGDDETKLAFLLELAHMQFGQAYDISDRYRPLLAELHHLGLVHVRDAHKSKSFYPTRLAAAIVSAGELAPGARVQGRIIVESNMRVYVYTSSRAWVETLALFLRLRTLLPNAVVASITRARVQWAMREHGLSAEAIIAFLSRNAHEEVRNRPAEERDKALTVYDQIRLWERELERYTARPAYYLSDFDTAELFEAELAHALATGTHLWHRREPGNARLCKLVLLGSDAVIEEARVRIKEFKRRAGLA